MCQYFINLIGPNNPEGSNAESDLKNGRMYNIGELHLLLITY